MSFALLAPHFAVANMYLAIAAPYAAAGALVLAIIAVFLILAQGRRLSRLLGGRTGSLEETLAVLSRDMKEMHEFRKELEKYLKLTESRLRGAVQGVGIVRFNPFQGEGLGGNQSFAAAFLDERGQGVVFSTLYTRERVGVYAKPIENGKSLFELSAEEKSAVDKAKESIAKNRKVA